MSSVYPGSLDSFTPKTDGVDYNLAAHINDLQDAVEAIETELGVNPAGSEADVKTRLDNMTVDVGAIIHAATDKATPVDADEIGIWDSVAGALKKLTWANLKATIYSALGALIAAGTSKATPVDADGVTISDSAASNATKTLTWANIKAALKTYFDTLYLSLSGGTMTGAINLDGNAIVSHTATIADDSVTSFVVGSSSHFSFLLSCLSNGMEYAWGRCNRSTGATSVFVNHASIATAKNTQLAGTTGSDDYMTISFYITDGKLYVENRRGLARAINVLIIG